jgi:hypothetical protein
MAISTLRNRSRTQEMVHVVCLASAVWGGGAPRRWWRGGAGTSIEMLMRLYPSDWYLLFLGTRY